MTEQNYAAMTEHELRQEIANLKEKARKAEQLGIVNEFAVYERKAIMAAAYLVDISTIIIGEMYRIDGAPGEFFQLVEKKNTKIEPPTFVMKEEDKIQQLESQLALSKEEAARWFVEDDKVSKERLANLQNEVENLKKDYNEKVAKWNEEKKSVDETKKLKEKLAELNAKVEKAENEANLELASKLKYQDMPALKKEIEEKENAPEKIKFKDIAKINP